MKTISCEAGATAISDEPTPEKCFSLKNILIPVDFSDGSMEALKYGRALGVASGAVVHAIYAMEPTAIVADLNGAPIMPPLDCEIATQRGVDLDELLSKDAPKGLVYTTESRIGYPPDVIKSFEAGRKIQSTVGEVYFRKEDHQLVRPVIIVVGKKTNDMKNKEDYYDVVEVLPGAPLMQKPDAFGCNLGSYT